MGKHNKTTTGSFCLFESYTQISKHLSRDNTNFLVLFKQHDLNLKHIFNYHVGTDMENKQFKKMCSAICCENYKFNVVFISRDNDMDNARYRKGFDNYIYLETEINCEPSNIHSRYRIALTLHYYHFKTAFISHYHYSRTPLISLQ